MLWIRWLGTASLSSGDAEASENIGTSSVNTIPAARRVRVLQSGDMSNMTPPTLITFGRRPSWIKEVLTRPRLPLELCEALRAGCSVFVARPLRIGARTRDRAGAGATLFAAERTTEKSDMVGNGSLYLMLTYVVVHRLLHWDQLSTKHHARVLLSCVR